jgi:sulfite dehydrogenase (quinone) subunit SoeB
MDAAAGVMKKCTLCVDRIYNTNLPEDRPRTRLRAHLPRGRAPFRRSGRPDSDVSRWWPNAAAWT